MRIGSFRFNLQEFGGAMADLGTLLPLMVALILFNGLNATMVLTGVGLFYILAGVYFRIPMPAQPLKAAGAIAIAVGASATEIGAAGILMGIILLFLSLTNLIGFVVKAFPHAVVRGIQLTVGIMLIKKGIKLAMDEKLLLNGTSKTLEIDHELMAMGLIFLAITIFVLFKFVLFRNSQRIPPTLALIAFGVATGLLMGFSYGGSYQNTNTLGLTLPSGSDFWIALTVLVIPQLPLTLGNAVVGTSDTARVYFGDGAKKVTPRGLTASMGLYNLMAGLAGAMPMCHGSGGLTAHYKLGAKTGGASIMIGLLFLVMGIVFGYQALIYISVIPLAVLGVMLAIVGIYHALLAGDLVRKRDIAVAATVLVVHIFSGNMAIGFGTGILLYHALNQLQKRGGSLETLGIYAWTGFPPTVNRVSSFLKGKADATLQGLISFLGTH